MCVDVEDGALSVMAGYGLTESVGFYQPLRDWLRKAGSAGLLMPHLEARLVGEDGKDVEEGEPGELWLRGPCMFKVSPRILRQMCVSADGR